MISINDLPPEVLAHIFRFYIELQGYRRFLKNIPLVCKRWNEVYLIPTLWENASSPGNVYSSVEDDDDDDDTDSSEDIPENYNEEITENYNEDLEEWSWEERKKLGEKGLLSSVRELCLDRCPFNEYEMTKFMRYFHNLRELKVIDTLMPRAAMEVLADQCSNINFLFLSPCDHQIEDVFTPFLRVRGQSIKSLYLAPNSLLKENNWVSTIVETCPSLEDGIFSEYHEGKISSLVQFPIFELIVGCPKLRVLIITGYKFPREEVRDHKGFCDIKQFMVKETDFGGVELYSILKNAKNLEFMEMIDCQNVTWSRISQIPSEKLGRFEFEDQNLNSLEFLKEFVARLKNTLVWLTILTSQRDLTEVLEAYLHENSDPKLERLNISSMSNLSAQMIEQLRKACMDFEISYW